MSERTYLFLMTAEQAETFGRLAEAANRGNGDAACRLGDMYREGLGGLRYSPKQTFRWYSRSALAGDPSGQNNLGACYEHGLGCEQSYVKAVRWYRLAAAQKLGTASMNLGYCYLRGHGVPADKEEALRLFRLAVEQGEEKAAKEVERLESSVTFGRIPKGFKDRTKDGGGLALIGGKRLPVDKEDAQVLLRLAVERGEDKARQELERLDGPMKGPRVRFVDKTVPGKNLGIVGVGGVTPSASQEANAASGKRPWTGEDQYRADLGAWEKDDCFDLPDPDSEYGRRMKAGAEEAIERLIREGGAPRLPDRPVS